jgi:hypothetical protein
MDAFQETLKKLAYEAPSVKGSPAGSSKAKGNLAGTQKPKQVNTDPAKKAPQLPTSQAPAKPVKPGEMRKMGFDWLRQKMAEDPNLPLQPGAAKPPKGGTKKELPIPSNLEPEEKKAEAMTPGELWVYGKIAMEKVAQAVSRHNA